MATDRILSIAAAVTILVAVSPQEVVADDVSGTRSVEGLFSISGQVVDALDGYYVVRSDGGRTRVRFPGWPSDLPGGQSLVAIGDEITALGRLGPETLSGGTLDVLGVYVKDRRAYFALGEAVEDMPETMTPTLMPSGGFTPQESSATLTGLITAIGDGALTLTAGEVEVTVETASLHYDPFDDVGDQVLEPGDLVMVGGTLAPAADGEPRLRAESVTSIFVLGAAT